MRMLVLGAGQQGSACAYDLLVNSSHEVALADVDPGNPPGFLEPFVGGRLTLLRLDVTEAAVWITEGGLLKYAFEVAKANASKTTPDVGERRDLNFH